MVARRPSSKQSKKKHILIIKPAVGVLSIGRAGGGSCIQRWWTGGPGRTCSRGGYPRPGGSSPGAVAGRHGAASLCAGTGEGDLDLWVAVIRGRFYHRDRRGT